ncbi:FKBP-type peptidyl-prolyl cis-trans isomerase [Altererythrobacter sp. ZODW24]|uniref:FKBP-type peptidyl-prolyl cis-trans isomerase n=1 Tax=Altererythrobacter sp. ZODW24 TaxID=2185142 RepID=UPI000DF7A41D|nr:FKBP-type peptidyl-prolyl cis-trans isomerase [Altererythrobacter sp. ZODW24]
MTEVTSVPIQPIAKGSLVKLWLGVLVAVLIGAGIAWYSAPKGLSVSTITEGTGGTPAADDVVFVRYKGMLADGSTFDESQDLPLPIPGIFPEGNPLPLNQMVPGFSEGAQQMQKGGKYVLEIPAEKGYGAEEKANPQTGEVVIPANSDLTFEVEMIDFMSEEDFQNKIAQIQQMMAAQQGAQPGAPGAGGAPAPQGQ